MIPIRDVNPTARFAWVTLGLIVLNVAVFFFWEPVTSDAEAQQEFFLCHAQIPYEVTHQTSLGEGGSGARTGAMIELKNLPRRLGTAASPVTATRAVA